MNNNPDIQFFGSSGTWRKPSRAVRVDIVLQGGQGGVSSPAGTSGNAGCESTSAHLGRILSPNGYVASNGAPGEIRVSSFAAGDLPDTVEVEVGKGGRPGGRDGYALVITHLEGQ